MSYAVIWREGGDATHAGKLELGAEALRLDGLSSDGSPIRRRIPYGEIVCVRIGRLRTDRLKGRATVILERVTAPAISIAAVIGVGIVFELDEVLAET